MARPARGPVRSRRGSAGHRGHGQLRSTWHRQLVSAWRREHWSSAWWARCCWQIRFTRHPESAGRRGGGCGVPRDAAGLPNARFCRIAGVDHSDTYAAFGILICGSVRTAAPWRAPPHRCHACSKRPDRRIFIRYVDLDSPVFLNANWPVLDGAVLDVALRVRLVPGRCRSLLERGTLGRAGEGAQVARKGSLGSELAVLLDRPVCPGNTRMILLLVSSEGAWSCRTDGCQRSVR